MDAESTGPAVKLINSALSRAIEDGASDVHFDPEEDAMIVRARVDGVVRELTRIPRSLQPSVITRLKIMASLDIAERRMPQDGRVLVRRAGDPVDLRMAVLPTTHGEKVVLRLLQRSTSQLALADLGMSPHAEVAFTHAVRQPYGALIVCGPTGSGKTTTLYAALKMLNEPRRVLITIEDPVEYQSPGVAQMEVNVRSGLTFARGLRTILRSDPDVLLVGEIRDEETAHIAVQAAMTGHVVLTSLHSHSAASAVARLKDMEVDPGLLAASVNCIVAQRLARRLCGDRRRTTSPHDRLGGRDPRRRDRAGDDPAGARRHPSLSRGRLLARRSTPRDRRSPRLTRAGKPGAITRSGMDAVSRAPPAGDGVD